MRIMKLQSVRRSCVLEYICCAVYF